MNPNHIPLDEKCSCGYFENYEEASIEKPSDGLNGDCIVHYDYAGADMAMHVRLVNGKREGDAIIYENRVPRTRVQYRDGELTGIVEKYDDSGNVVMRGHLVNGIESGLFKEYTDSMVTWMGYYRNGDRYSEVIRHEYLDGFYEERCIDDDRLLSIAHYDESLHDKSGYTIEFVAGDVMEWVVENGIKRPIRRYGRVEDRRSRIQEKRRRSIDESDSMPKRVRRLTQDSLIQVSRNSRYEYGVREENGRFYEVKSSLYENRIVEADASSHEMRVFVNNVLTTTIGYEKSCVDVNTNGRRWEGNVQDGNPYGYGVFYDEEGNKEYEGFVVGSRRVCYGIEYYSDIQKIKYKGTYFEGKRHGRGVLYDRRGSIDHDGLWMNDLPYFSDGNDRLSDDHMESIIVSNGKSLPTRLFILHSTMQSLKRIVIGSNALGSIRFFVVDGLSELESILIDEWSCMKTDPFAEIEDDSQESSEDDDGDNQQRDGNNQRGNNNNGNHPRNQQDSEPKNKNRATQPDGTFRVTNCPKLKSLQIGDCSFHDYLNSFELRNLPSLLSVVIGEFCFRDTMSLSLTGLAE